MMLPITMLLETGSAIAAPLPADDSSAVRPSGTCRTTIRFVRS